MVSGMVRNLAALVPAVVILTACQDPVVPLLQKEMVLGVSAVDAPATVVAVQSFVVKLTVHFGGCARFDRFETRVSGSRLEVTAVGVDDSGPKNLACPDILWSAEKELTIPGASPGTLTLVILQPHGKTIEREVQVVTGVVNQ
jgi:hypothetical protein